MKKRTVNCLIAAVCIGMMLAACSNSSNAAKVMNSGEKASAVNSADPSSGGMSAIPNITNVEDTTIPETVPETEAPELSIEAGDSAIVPFRDYSGDLKVSAYVAVKNTSDVCIKFTDLRFDYEDNDGKLLTTDQYVDCIPEAIKPGQTAYLYSYHQDMKNVDTSNGVTIQPDGDIEIADKFFEIDTSDVSFSADGSWVNVIGRGTNNTDREHSLAMPGAVFFDKNGKVMGFGYGYETFEPGRTKTFEVSGYLLSDDYKTSDVKSVELYIQGDEY